MPNSSIPADPGLPVVTTAPLPAGNSSVAPSSIVDIINTTQKVPPIFLQTPAAQGVAGVFAFAALLITCHQVSSFSFHL